MMKYTRVNEDGDTEFCQEMSLKLRFVTYDKSFLENIENDILEVLNDKSFDGLGYFEKIESKENSINE